MAEKKNRVVDYDSGKIECDEWVEVDDILDKELEIYDVRVMTPAEGDLFLCLGVKVEGEEGTKGFSCGGKIVVHSIRRALEQSKLPLWVKIVKEKAYYEIR